MSEKSNKLLVALDGSEKAFKTIAYISRFKPFLKYDITLHNIITRVPECYYDLKKEPFSYNITSQVRAWEMGYKGKMQTFMDKARMKLLTSGFKPEAVTAVIADRKAGIARDILEEAGKGCHALVTRRRGGAKTMLPLAMGSVSTKLVDRSQGFPLILAGTKKETHSLLVAVDGSKSAHRAVDFVGRTVGPSGCRIILCSVLRDFGTKISEDDNHPSPPDCIHDVFCQIEEAVGTARNTLISCGLENNQIATAIVRGASSRAGAIVDCANQEKCSTIVFGRKGTSEVENFLLGSVPRKVIHGARKMTIWLVP
jgi:nucleotide-binding universal stress UspA family protein